VVVRGQDLYGKPVKYKVKGFVARVFQHEIDHLSGIIFTDLVIPNTLHKAKPAQNEAEEESEMAKTI
jgi:peptide deformylase